MADSEDTPIPGKEISRKIARRIIARLEERYRPVNSKYGRTVPLACVLEAVKKVAGIDNNILYKDLQ